MMAILSKAKKEGRLVETEFADDVTYIDIGDKVTIDDALQAAIALSRRLINGAAGGDPATASAYAELVAKGITEGWQ